MIPSLNFEASQSEGVCIMGSAECLKALSGAVTKFMMCHGFFVEGNGMGIFLSAE